MLVCLPQPGGRSQLLGDLSPKPSESIGMTVAFFEEDAGPTRCYVRIGGMALALPDLYPLCSNVLCTVL